MKLKMIQRTLVAAVLLGTFGVAQATQMPWSDDSAKANASDKSQPATDAKSQSATKADEHTLKTKVVDKLKSDQRLAKADIQPQVDNQGNVTLKGTVKSKEQSKLAEQLVADITGVREIHNDLMTSP